MSLGIIGGTGALDLFEVTAQESVTTPYGKPSTALARIDLGQQPAWFIARHGRPHRIPPHRINYRANIDALRRCGVERIVAVNAVGGIDPRQSPGSLVLPDQLIDYTWGRQHTFSDDDLTPLAHAEFARPFQGTTRQALLAASAASGVELVDGGCLGVTQGPRLETAAEVKRLDRDGCTMVGMTSMPEAGLAREAGLDYASVCVIANPGAGLEDEPIDMDEIGRVLSAAMQRVVGLLAGLGDDSG